MADTENKKNSNSPAERAQGNVPALRFPSFTEPWCVSKLKSYLKENKERNKHSEFAKEEVLSVSGQDGIINQIKHLGRSFAGKSVADYHVVRHGNIVYTKSPLKEYPYGIVKYNRGVDGIVSTLYAVYETNNKSDGTFVEYYFASVNRINRYFKPIVRIGAKHDMKIGNEEVLQNTVCFPDIMEQKKIATFLSLLDERIATQRRLIDKLETLIKGIAEFLTTNTPNTKIADCLVCHSSTRQENQAESFGKYCVYGASGICGYTDLPDVAVDSILVVKDGSGVGTVTYASGEYSVIGTSNYLTTKNGYLLRYLYYCLMCFNFTPYKTGMAIPHIYFKDYGKAKIYCPAIEEQRKIAAALSNIESKIEIERTILQQYTMQKQHLLQQMFI